jgi:hydroxymethylpyrimidine kinase/phosphomethylpyrimidine kinase
VNTALTIAGSDPSGGAGIQADLKTFAAFGVYGMAVITSLTAQNTRRVAGIFDVDPAFVALQIDTALDDIPAGAVKTGMLSSAGIITAVAGAVDRHAVRNLVVDPVMVATSGGRLLVPEAEAILKDVLLPRARIATPNAAEAEVLAGGAIDSLDSAKAAARTIAEAGPQAVLVKGGDWGDDGFAVDVLFDGENMLEISLARIDSTSTHGTGCTLSSAIAAGLALGLDLREAVERAKAYVHRAISHAPGLGGGHGPLDHSVSSRED